MFIQNVCILAGSLFYNAQQNSLLSSSMILAPVSQARPLQKREHCDYIFTGQFYDWRVEMNVRYQIPVMYLPLKRGEK